MIIKTGTVAVTGASGFLGRYLIEDLRVGGYEPLVLGRNPITSANWRQTDYSLESLKGALKGADAVVHLAGRRMTHEDDQYDIRPFLAPNVELVADLMTACAYAGIRKIIYASTIAVYSPESGLPYRETAPTYPFNAYGLSKVMGEACMEMNARKRGIESVSLRLAAVYGHGEKGTPVLMKFVNRALGKQTLNLKGNIDYRIDQIYVRDVTEAILCSLRAPAATGIFNIGGGRALPLIEIAETVNVVFNNIGNLHVEDEKQRSMPETAMDLTAAHLKLGWRPRYTLRSGLEDLAARARG